MHDPPNHQGMYIIIYSYTLHIAMVEWLLQIGFITAIVAFLQHLFNMSAVWANQIHANCSAIWLVYNIMAATVIV